MRVRQNCKREEDQNKRVKTGRAGKKVLFMRGGKRARESKTMREGWEEELRQTSAEKQKDR